MNPLGPINATRMAAIVAPSPRDRIQDFLSPQPECRPSHAVVMVTWMPQEQLLGRQRERAALDRVLGAAREGDGRVLVVHWEPGVGKTALLTYVVEAASAFRVLRTVGVEGEMELPFAALQQLCSPILDLLEQLPDPQRDALGIAFGLRSGSAPIPCLVGLAVL